MLTMKVDFTKIQLKNIEGGIDTADFSKQLGNQLYMAGKDIEECELGKRIYFSEGEIDLNEKEAGIVKQAIAPWGYVARKAIEDLM